MKQRFRLRIGTSPQPGRERGGQVTVRACIGTGSRSSMASSGWEGR